METMVSARGELRQKIWQMTAEDTEKFLQETLVVRVGTVDAEGFPYVVPQLFVYENGRIWLHQTSAKGHFRRNVEFNSRVCLEFDEHGEFFPYGATQCDTVVAYKSVIAFGTIRVADNNLEKLNFFDKFMIKYAGASWGREEHTYPRMDPTAVYEVQLEKVTGKHQEADVTLKRWDGSEGTVGGPGTYGCPFHQAALEAEAAQSSEDN
ncbi:MAG: pyridoxamine 5'-phosphate oxidase family protein [Nodosilinea sp.]